MHLSGTIDLTNLSDIASLAASGRLQNAFKYCTKSAQNRSGRPKSLIIRPVFNLESPKFAWTSIQTYYTALLDMTPPATSSQHLSTFELNAKNAT